MQDDAKSKWSKMMHILKLSEINQIRRKVQKKKFQKKNFWDAKNPIISTLHHHTWNSICVDHHWVPIQDDRLPSQVCHGQGL